MIKKQKLTIIICAISIIVLGILYFSVISPIINHSEDKKIPDLLEGESYDEAKDKIRIFPLIEKDDVTKLTVHNKTGEYGFYHDDDGEFYLSEYKGTPYSKQFFTTLMSATRDTLALDRVTTDTSDLKKYGLDPSDYPAWFEISNKNKDNYKVFIGNMIPTGGGYYVKLETRDAVYVLDTTLAYALKSANEYVTPLLSMPTDSKDYFQTQLFTLSVDGTPYISVEFMNESERAATASTSYYKMLVPENYTPSSANYEQMLKTFNSFEGTETVKFGKSDEAMSKEELAEYGINIDKPKYEIYYKYQGVDNYVAISAQNEDGTYYAYSLMFNILAKVSNETLQFLSWDFIDFLDKPMFQKNINDIAEITIKGKNIEETYTLDGKDQSLYVIPESTGKPFAEEELKSFKQLYIKLLSLSLEDYADSTSTDEWTMTFTVKTRQGLEFEYSFYNYSTRRCYFTINGRGEFYVLRDRVEKILSDVEVLKNGGVITGEKS